MNIWFVSQHEGTPVDDNTATRFNMMTQKAVDRGHKVTFWAPSFSHSSKVNRSETDKSIQISERLQLELLKIDGYKKHISAARLKANKMFAAKSVQAFNESSEMPDVVMLSFPPMILADRVSKWCSENGVPLVIDIIDPWPDSFLKLMKGYPKLVQDTILAKPRKNLRKTFSRCSAITGIAKARLTWAGQYSTGSIPTQVFYPAIDLSKVKEFRSKHKSVIEGRDQSIFRCIYAGSLGYSYDLPTILKAAEELQKRNAKVEIVIAGDGPQKPQVQEYSQKLNNIEYLGRIPKDQLMKEYLKADCGFIQHFPKATQTVTYKVFDYLSNSLPILNSLESELWGMIEDNRIGLNNTSGDHIYLAENIMKLQQENILYSELCTNATEYTAREGDSNVVYGRTIDLLEDIVSV